MQRKSDRSFLEAPEEEREDRDQVVRCLHPQPLPRQDSPRYAASVLDGFDSDDAIFTADTGMCNVWTARYITPNGSASAGFLPRLHGRTPCLWPSGAQIAEPNRQVISVSG